MATSERLSEESLLGLNSVATARIYPAWFTESADFTEGVLGTCQ